MVNIIEKANIKCTKCNCVFTFEKDDLKCEDKYLKQKVDSYKSIYNHIFYINCPICNNTYIIKNEQYEKY